MIILVHPSCVCTYSSYYVLYLHKDLLPAQKACPRGRAGDTSSAGAVHTFLPRARSCPDLETGISDSNMGIQANQVVRAWHGKSFRRRRIRCVRHPYREQHSEQ